MRRLRILLVDDHAVIRVTTAEFLREEGYDVTEAEDGQRAVELFDAFRPDLVLLDIQMPGMNGVRVAEALHERDADVPMIAVTGTPYLIDEQQYLFKMVFRKPVSLAQFERAHCSAFCAPLTERNFTLATVFCVASSRQPIHFAQEKNAAGRGSF